MPQGYHLHYLKSCKFLFILFFELKMTCKWLNLCNIYLTLYWLFFLPTGELNCSNCKWSIQESWSLWSSSVKQHACIWSDCFPSYTMYISQSLREYKVHSFSSPEANLLLLSTKNCDLWETQFSKRVQRICFRLDLCLHRVTEVCELWTSGVGASQRSWFLVLTKRSAPSGDENGGP